MHRATDFDSRQARTSFGFTLVELLVVIGIIGMLVALLLPAVMSAQEQARQTQCAKQMKDLAGANLAHAMKKGRFPGWQEEVGGDHHSWVVRIMPYLDMQEQSRLGIYKHDPIFYCPSNPPEVTGDTNLALSYRANVGSGSDGVFVDLGSGSSANPVGLEDIRDGKRNTLLLAESAIHLSNSSVPGWGPDSSTRTNTDLGFLYESSNSTGATNLNKVDNNTTWSCQ